jgi:hypothetical protein
LCGAEEGERTMELRVWSEAHVKKRSNTPLRERGGARRKRLKKKRKMVNLFMTYRTYIYWSHDIGDL